MIGRGSAGTPLKARIAAWWRNLPLMRAFACYTVGCLLLAGSISLAIMAACMQAYYHLDEQQNAGRVEVDSGPYVYDAASDALVPAVSVDLGEFSGDRLLFLGLRNGVGRTTAETEGRDLGAASEVGTHAGVHVEYTAGDMPRIEYATIAMLRDDAGFEILDWGGNYTEADYIEAGGNPYDPTPIAIEDLAAYDACERAERVSVEGSLGDAAAALGTADEDVVISNVGYYVMQPLLTAEPPLMLTLRLAAGFCPFVVLGVCAVLMFRRFYRRRLAEPLGALRASAERVAAQDLDFTVEEVAGREFGRLARAFERMRSSLAEAQRALFEKAEERRRLNAAFAHDMRTPLTVLKGTVEMMEGPADASASEVAVSAAAIAALKGQVSRLESYAQAMGGITKLEERPVERTPFTFAALAGDLGCAARAVAARAGRTCRVQARNECAGAASARGLVLSVDAALVEEVLGNVMGNACRYAASRADLTIRLSERGPDPESEAASGGSAAAGDGSLMLELAVTDDGPGFSAEALHRGCEAFFSEQKSAEHFGLGLAISATLARLHGGEIRLGNDAEGGANVVATFAVDAVPDPAPDPAPGPPHLTSER